MINAFSNVTSAFDVNGVLKAGSGKLVLSEIEKAKEKETSREDVTSSNIIENT